MLTRVRDRRGMALPLTIFLVTLVTILLASAFVRGATEHEVAGGTGVSVKALAIARSGLHAYLGAGIVVRPALADSVRWNFPGGYAWVTPHLMQNSTDSLNDFTYVIRATGYYVDPLAGSDPIATRTIAQFASWKQSVRRPAAFVAANENEVNYTNGSDFVIDGNDACSAGALGGVRSQGGSDALPGTVMGSPPQFNDGTAYDIALSLGIDWAAIESGEWSADYSDLSTADGDTTYSTYLIDNFQEDIDAISGTGLLIVLNRVDSFGFDWDGVVIIGKDFDVREDTTRIRGMLITGMDGLVGDADYPSNTFAANTDLEVTYDSCNIARSFRSWRGFDAVENTWVDNWAGY